MEGTIKVKYKGKSEWTELNAKPTSYRMGIQTLYAVAPFERARIDFNIMGMFAIYEYKNGRVRKVI